MIQQHLGVWFWRGPEPPLTKFDYPALLSFNALGGGAAPLFIMLAGMGCALLASRRRAGVDRTLVVRGLVLMGFGYLLSVGTPSWMGWRTWFVLHLMGFGMCLTPLFRRLSPKWLLVSAIAVLAATPLVQAALETPHYLNNARMAGHVDFIVGGPIVAGGHLRLALAEGQFPVFPWFSLFLAGLATGRLVVERRLKPVLIVAGAALVLGLTMIGLYFGGVEFARDARRVFGMNVPFFPATVAFVAAIGGLCALTVVGIIALERRRPFKDTSVLVVLGRSSLTLLLVHVWVFRQIRPLNLWRSLEPVQVLGAITVVLIVLGFVTHLWRRIDYRYGAEWVLRQAARLAAPRKRA